MLVLIMVFGLAIAVAFFTLIFIIGVKDMRNP